MTTPDLTSRPTHDSRARTTRQKSTATTDPADTAVVHWPEPSQLESWWNSVMKSPHTLAG
ncbi:hypothetical protein ACIA8C_24215 [Nocardia sp. NPDC051321]|uniref:hypothetical protein n=1 Tax=Nocardia sp. NPDC051321 TaxID=3364323 RepID=UPI0037AC2918